jgi:hypothetical protein
MLYYTTVPDKQILLNTENIQHDFSFPLLTYKKTKLNCMNPEGPQTTRCEALVAPSPQLRKMD